MPTLAVFGIDKEGFIIVSTALARDGEFFFYSTTNGNLKRLMDCFDAT